MYRVQLSLGILQQLASEQGRRELLRQYFNEINAENFIEAIATGEGPVDGNSVLHGAMGIMVAQHRFAGPDYSKLWKTEWKILTKNGLEIVGVGDILQAEEIDWPRISIPEGLPNQSVLIAAKPVEGNKILCSVAFPAEPFSLTVLEFEAWSR
jgi:hypothetical protein